MPSSLSLGIRQRLQLAAACLHQPEVLILDEPTSGVDPAARDLFWRHMVRLSREEGVTLFVSTHFMNEAMRCDRISLMHRGRVLALGDRKSCANNRAAETLEQAFIDYLEADSEAEVLPHHLIEQDPWTPIPPSKGKPVMPHHRLPRRHGGSAACGPLPSAKPWSCGMTPSAWRLPFWGPSSCCAWPPGAQL